MSPQSLLDLHLDQYEAPQWDMPFSQVPANKQALYKKALWGKRWQYQKPRLQKLGSHD